MFEKFFKKQDKVQENVQEKIQKQQERNDKDCELTDEELEMVTGGSVRPAAAEDEIETSVR